MYYCYKIMNKINKKNYIGITSNINRRIRQHRHEAKINKNPLYQSIRKYGFDNFNIIIVDCKETWKDICVIEINTIKQLKAKNRQYGYNLSSGGEGAYGAVRSEKTKAKLRAITKKQMTLKARKHLSKIAKKQMSNPANRELSRQGALKQMSDPEMKKRCLSGLKKYYKNNPNAYKKNAKGKPCTYNNIKYKSIAEAARKNNMAESTMRRKVIINKE